MAIVNCTKCDYAFEESEHFCPRCNTFYVKETYQKTGPLPGLPHAEKPTKASLPPPIERQKFQPKKVRHDYGPPPTIPKSVAAKRALSEPPPQKSSGFKIVLVILLIIAVLLAAYHFVGRKYLGKDQAVFSMATKTAQKSPDNYMELLDSALTEFKVRAGDAVGATEEQQINMLGLFSEAAKLLETGNNANFTGDDLMAFEQRRMYFSDWQAAAFPQLRAALTADIKKLLDNNAITVQLLGSNARTLAFYSKEFANGYTTPVVQKVLDAFGPVMQLLRFEAMNFYADANTLVKSYPFKVFADRDFVVWDSKELTVRNIDTGESMYLMSSSEER